MHALSEAYAPLSSLGLCDIDFKAVRDHWLLKAVEAGQPDAAMQPQLGRGEPEVEAEGGGP